MSYNLDTFRVKALDGLVIPLAALNQPGRYTLVQAVKLDWQHFCSTGELRVRAQLSAEDSEITGALVGTDLQVSEIRWRGEGSGSQFTQFEAMLRQSRGTLVARLVWEGGDTIETLTVRDGVVERVELD